MLNILTDLGDATLILPASLIFAIYLWTVDARRPAITWSASMALCVIFIVLSKIGFHACGEWVAALGIHSPSGHAAFAATFYGCGALLLGNGQSGRLRIGLGLLAVILITTIA